MSKGKHASHIQTATVKGTQRPPESMNLVTLAQPNQPDGCVTVTVSSLSKLKNEDRELQRAGLQNTPK